MRIPILFDTRNPAWMREELAGLGYDVVRRMLVTGDFIWSVPGGRCGLEMKALDDLLVSHQNGRLDEELYRLQFSFSLPILLLVGMLDSELDVPDIGGWTWGAVDNMLLGRQRRGIYVVRASCMERVPDRLDSLIKYTQRAPREAKRSRHYAFQGPLTGRAEVVYSLLSAVRGIRDKTKVAERLAAKYSLHDLFALDAGELQKEGFTKMMAGRVVEMMEGRDV